MQKQSEHRTWWMRHREELLEEIKNERARTDRVTLIAERHATALEDLRHGVIAEIDTDEDHPLHVYLERAAVIEAHNKLQAAYRLRDRVMRAAWHLDELHHDDRGKCKCGKQLKDCREYRILIPYRTDLGRWEHEQERRMREGKPHALPLDHPKAPKNDRWSWNGAPSLREEIDRLERPGGMPSLRR